MTRIMVVDRDADFLRFMADALGDHGMQVVPCRNTSAAYAALRAGPPDAIILDIRIEGPRSGWELLTYLTLHPEFHAIPTILCTTSIIDASERKEWLAEHRVVLLAKPFDLEELYTRVNTGLARRVEPCSA